MSVIFRRNIFIDFLCSFQNFIKAGKTKVIEKKKKRRKKLKELVMKAILFVGMEQKSFIRAWKHEVRLLKKCTAFHASNKTEISNSRKKKIFKSNYVEAQMCEK
jgi:hypothetical protein